MKNAHAQYTKAFTLVELVITIAIFAGMTMYLLAKYGTFNQSILLTNLAYDVALTIRTAQSYGLNVKSNPLETASNYTYPYGVHFNMNQPSCFVFFVDSDSDPSASEYLESTYCTPVSDPQKISAYSLKRGSVISDLCVKVSESDACQSVDYIDISFRRPDPEARILADGLADWTYADITLKATDNSLKHVIVRSTGQIAILN